MGGAPVAFDSSRDAEAAGIVLIHQELNLADHLSIVQNMFLGHEKRRGFLLDEPAMREAARVRLNDVGLHKNPDTKVRDLIVAEKQLVEIAKAMLREARLLIMDEPTATLTPAETQRLFALMARLKEDGVTIVYISHKLDEVERVTDEVIVMRDGRFVTRAPTAEVTRQQMANLMVGREVSDMFPAKPPLAADAPVALKVDGVSVPGWARQRQLRGARGRGVRLRGARRRGAHGVVRRADRRACAHGGQHRARWEDGRIRAIRVTR